MWANESSLALLKNGPIPVTISMASDEPIHLYAALALTQQLDGNPEAAADWLAKIPRSERGAVNIALDDLAMTLSRLGRRVDG